MLCLKVVQLNIHLFHQSFKETTRFKTTQLNMGQTCLLILIKWDLISLKEGDHCIIQFHSQS